MFFYMVILSPRYSGVAIVEIQLKAYAPFYCFIYLYLFARILLVINQLYHD